MTADKRGPRIHRMTLFKIPDEMNQKRLLDAYHVVAEEQKKVCLFVVALVTVIHHTIPVVIHLSSLPIHLGSKIFITRLTSRGSFGPLLPSFFSLPFPFFYPLNVTISQLYPT